MIPQLIMIALGFISLVWNISRHGEDSKTKLNGWHKLIALIIYWTILYYGGFWDVLIKN